MRRCVPVLAALALAACATGRATIPICPGPSEPLRPAHAEIESERERCRREARIELDGRFPSEATPLVSAERYDTCIERAQIARGEIWMFEIGQVYVRSASASDRRVAILGCSQNLTPIERSEFDADITRVRADPSRVTACMGEHGWEPLF